MSLRRFLALAGLAAFGSSVLPAQEAPPAGAPANPATAPAPVPAAPGNPAGQAPGRGGRFGDRGARPSAPDSVGRITLVDEQPAQVVALLEKITGRIALRSGDLPPAKINFNSNRDLSRREAETALESLLALNGVAAIPEGDAFLKIVPAGNNKSPGGEAPPLFLESTASLPASDRFVARLFTLKNVPYVSLDAAIQAVVNKNRGGTAIPMAGSNAVLVTDSLSNVQRIEAIVEKLDAPGKVLFIPLKNTRAPDVVKQLKALQAAGLKTAFAGDVGIESNEVSNQLIVVTNPSNEERIRALVAGIDIENAPVTRTEVIALKHGEAADAVALIQNVAQGTTGSIGQKTSSTFTPQGATGASGGNNRTTQANTAGVRLNPQQQGQAGQNNANRAAISDDAASFSNNFTAVADLRSNSIVVYGTDRDLRQAKELIAAVDVQLQQVRIEAVIVEVTLGTAQASGLDTLGLGLYTGTQGVVNGRHNGDINFNTQQPNLPGTGTPPLAISGSIKDFSLQAVFNKARDDSNVRLLSSPTIITSHNAKAVVVVSTQQPIISGSTSTPTNTGTTTTSAVTYTDIGLELDIIPRIGANGVVEMDVQQSIKSIIGNTTIDGNQQPIISNRAANSYVTAENNETIVLAGLQSVTDTKTKGKVFILGDIPWLGEWLFQPETTQTTKSELIIFLKPHVMAPADRVPAADTPGLRPGSLTKEDASYWIKHGSFPDMKETTTVFERDEGEIRADRIEDARKRQEREQAAREKAWTREEELKADGKYVEPTPPPVPAEAPPTPKPGVVPEKPAKVEAAQ